MSTLQPQTDLRRFTATVTATNGRLPQFREHPWFPGGHLQTIAGAYLPGPWFPYQATQHRVDLPDEDAVILHDDRPENWTEGDRVALLIHGLGGTHQSPYVVRIAARLNERGIRTFRIDMRACGAGVHLARRPYHAGLSGDVSAAIEKIAQICPGSPLSLLGFSLGGNIVLKLLGEVKDKPPGHLDSAMVTAPPIKLEECSRSLTGGIYRLYDRAYSYFAFEQMKQMRENSPHFADIRVGSRPRRLVDFDEAFTAVQAGFDSAEEYYRLSSAARVIDRIRIPTTILTAADDPVVPAAIFQDVKFSDCTTVHQTERGGHLGYLSDGSSDPDRRWMEWRFVEWMAELDGIESRES